MLKKRFAPLLLTALLTAACSNQQDDSAGTKDAPGKSAAASPSSGQGASGGNRNKPQMVTTTQTTLRNLPLVLSAQGNVLSLDEVDVRAQKTGTVAQVQFSEGQEVRRGQVLFSLDDREDAAAVKRAEAAVVGARAQLDIAERDLKRAQDLSAQNFVSSSALDTARNKVDSARAGMQENQAALEQAKVALTYSVIRAPFDGRAGRIDVRVGSLVTTTTPMVKVSRMHPIGVSFTLPERDLPMLLASQREKPVRVEVETGDGRKAPGEVSFIDSTVDRVAGTIAIKARIDNNSRNLWPGQYVTTRVTVGELKDVVVLPAQAIVNGPTHRFVYVVKDDATVTPQNVELQRIVDGQAVVTGIGGGVKIVLEGGQNLRPGGRIEEAAPLAANGESAPRKRRDGKKGGNAGSGEGKNPT